CSTQQKRPADYPAEPSQPPLAANTAVPANPMLFGMPPLSDDLSLCRIRARRPTRTPPKTTATAKATLCSPQRNFFFCVKPRAGVSGTPARPYFHLPPLEGESLPQRQPGARVSATFQPSFRA